MINPALYGKPVAIDVGAHRNFKLGRPMDDWSVAAKLNAIFVAAVEFGDVAAEYPIVFVNAGTGPDGKQQVAPIAVFGLSNEENLYVADGKWRARYQPAMLRAYPFGIARADADRAVVVIDEAWPGWSQTEGQALFGDDGKPTPYLATLRDQLEKIEIEVQRTRFFGQALVDAGLLVGMRFDATLPDGTKITVDGFLALDEERFEALPDATMVELFKSGVMGMIYAHHFSLGTFPLLLQRRFTRLGSAGV